LVWFRLKPKNSNPHGFELHRPSIKGTKLLLKVIKTIIIINENLLMLRCSSSCVLCTSGKYSSEMGQIAESTCTECPAATYSDEGSKLLTNCTCKRGYTGEDGTECVAYPIKTPASQVGWWEFEILYQVWRGSEWQNNPLEECHPGWVSCLFLLHIQ